MKSEERHHLEQNELADWLTNIINNARQYFPIAAGTIAILFVLGFGYVYWSRSEVAETRDAWNDFRNAAEAVREYSPIPTEENSKTVFEFAADRFETIASAYPGTEVATRARIRAAQYRFEFAKSLLLKDRGQAVTKLDETVSEFDKLAKDQQLPSDVRQQALMGKALAQESLGALKDARETLLQFASQFEGIDPDSALKAKERAKLLENEDIAKFYDKLAEYKPAEPSMDLPPMNKDASSVPSPPTDALDFTLPGLDKVTVPAPPAIDDKDKKEEAEKKPAEPAESKEEKPAAPEEKPASEAKPASEKPAEPAPETTPEAEKKEPAKPEVKE